VSTSGDLQLRAGLIRIAGMVGQGLVFVNTFEWVNGSQDLAEIHAEVCSGISRKAKGRFSFEIRPSLSDFSKIWFGAQITATRHFRMVRSLRAEPALPVLSRYSIHCKSFLVPCVKQPVS
jgi:hypothetical protein